MAAEDPAWVRNLHVAADRSVPAYRRAFLDSVIAARNDFNVTEVERLLRLGRVDAAYEVAEAVVDLQSRTLQTRIMSQTMDTMRAGAAASQAAQRLIIPGGFDIFNPETHLWAQNYTYDLVREMRADQLTAIRQAITRTTQGATYMEAAREIRGTIGLTARMEQTVGNYRARLVAQQLPAKRVDVLTSRYRDKMIRRRAETIARTESVRAVNQGQVQAWRQWSTTRKIPVMKRWITTRDDLLCDLCRPMHKQTVPLNAMFTPKKGAGVDAPPLHPNCRCVVALVKATTPKQQKAAIAGMRATPTGLVERFKPANILLQEALLRVATASAAPAASSVEALTELFTGPARPATTPTVRTSPSDSAATVDATQVIRDWAAQNRYQRELRQAVRTGGPRPRLTASTPPPALAHVPLPPSLADPDYIAAFQSVTARRGYDPGKELIEHWFGKGVTTMEDAFRKIAVPSPDGTLWSVGFENASGIELEIHASTASVSTTRRFFTMRDGTRVVEHDYFRVDKALQNSGFSKRQLGKQFRFYRDSGIDEVRVHANIDVGGYAWARAGFLPTQDSLNYLTDFILTAARELHTTRAITTEAMQHIQALTTRLVNGDGKALWEIADLRDVVTADLLESGEMVTQELGKHLLKHSDWEGTINMHSQAQTDRLFHYYGEK